VHALINCFPAVRGDESTRSRVNDQPRWNLLFIAQRDLRKSATRCSYREETQAKTGSQNHGRAGAPASKRNLATGVPPVSFSSSRSGHSARRAETERSLIPRAEVAAPFLRTSYVRAATFGGGLALALALALAKAISRKRHATGRPLNPRDPKRRYARRNYDGEKRSAITGHLKMEARWRESWLSRGRARARTREPDARRRKAEAVGKHRRVAKRLLG